MTTHTQLTAETVYTTGDRLGKVTIRNHVVSSGQLDTKLSDQATLVKTSYSSKHRRMHCTISVVLSTQPIDISGKL